MSRQTRRCRCPRCGGVFFTEMKTKTYCTEDCRKGAERSRYYQRRKARTQ